MADQLFNPGRCPGLPLVYHRAFVLVKHFNVHRAIAAKPVGDAGEDFSKRHWRTRHSDWAITTATYAFALADAEQLTSAEINVVLPVCCEGFSQLPRAIRTLDDECANRPMVIVYYREGGPRTATQSHGENYEAVAEHGGEATNN